jgi:hypothetical protein
MKIPKPALAICFMTVAALMVSVIHTYTRPRSSAASLEETTGSLAQGEPSSDQAVPWSSQIAVPF